MRWSRLAPQSTLENLQPSRVYGTHCALTALGSIQTKNEIQNAVRDARTENDLTGVHESYFSYVRTVVG